MSKIINNVILVIALVLILGACGNADTKSSTETKVAKSNNVSDSGIDTEKKSENLIKLTAEEIYKFKLLRADWTEDKMLSEGMKNEVNEGAGERYYYNESIKYCYGNIYGNNTTPDYLDVYGKIDVEGPRGIAIGDSFEDVLSKFPQEKDWKKSVNGEFYGEISKDAILPTGLISTNDDTKKIVIWPQEQVPRLVISFKDDKVEHYVIYIQNIFD